MNFGFRFLILVPVGLLLLVALYRLAVGRALTRRTFDTVLALLLLGYFGLTVGLGIFWVANQHLPVFDLHYLVGYVTLALVVVHVVFNWHVLMGFFRKRAPAALVGDGGRSWRPALRTCAWVVGLVVYAGLFYWLGRGQVSRIEITRAPLTVAETAGATASQPQAPPSLEWPIAAPLELQMVTVEGEDEPRTLADHYHQEVKHTRISIMGDSGVLNWATKPSVFKAYPDAKVVDLPAPAESADMSVGAAIDACRRPAQAFGADAITLADVSTMLRMTNGVTSTLYSARSNRRYLLRAAPSAGALYPTVTYVIARNVAGLPAGVYHYAVDEHKLHRLRTGEEACAEWAAVVARGHLVESAPVTFVFTSAFFRSAWKYRERSYRYCGLDAGHLVVQTALSAAALGYGSHPIGRFDDARVNALLDLDESEEGVLLVLPVGVVADLSRDPSGDPEFALAPKTLNGKSGPLLLLMHGSTRLDLTGATVRPLPLAEPMDKPYPDSAEVELSGELPEGDDLFSTIERRRSIRDWADPGIALEEFSSVMYSAFGRRRGAVSSPAAAAALYDASVEDNHALNLYVIVNRIEDIEPGVYHYRRDDHTLAELAGGDFRRQAYEASLSQDVVGDADAVLVMTIDLSRLGYPDGDRGYRYAALDAGMLGGRLYLQTTGMELGCCGIGAYFDDEVSEIIGVSPAKELVIYVAAIGAKKPDADR